MEHEQTHTLCFIRAENVINVSSVPIKVYALTTCEQESLTFLVIRRENFGRTLTFVDEPASFTRQFLRY